MYRLKAVLPALLAMVLAACTPPKPIMKTPAQVLAELEPHYRVFKPEAPAPYPVIVFLHAATDLPWFSHYEKIHKILAKAGFASVHVDSYTGRGITGHSIRSGVLRAAERAGDALVTLEWVRRQPWADAKRLALVGQSWGGTTVLDTLVLAPPERKPTGLKAVPARGLDGVRAAVVFYPWCSEDIMGYRMVEAVYSDWSVPIPLLALMPEHESVGDGNLCHAIYDRHRRKGLPVEVEVFAGTGHNFDSITDDYGTPYASYQPEAAGRAYDRMLKFLHGNLQ